MELAACKSSFLFVAFGRLVISNRISSGASSHGGVCRSIGSSGCNWIGLPVVICRFLVTCLEGGVLFWWIFSRRGENMGSRGD